MRRLLALFVLVAGCGDDGAHVDAAPDSFVAHCTPTVTILTNHGHVMVVTLADVNGGMPRSYDIQGTADHGHRVTLSVDDFAMIQQSMSVSVHSTDADVGPAHDHAVRIDCN